MDRNPPIKILHVFGRMNVGGAESRTMEVMRNLDRGRYLLHYCSLSGLPGYFDEEIRSLGGAVHLCGLGPFFPWRFRRLLREERYDAVHSHVHHFTGYLLRLSAMESIPVRIAHYRSSHDGRGDSLRRRIQRSLMEGWVETYANHILAVGEGVMEAVRGERWRDDPRCRIIYNGVDLAPYRGEADRKGVRTEFRLPPDTPLVLHIGNFEAPKNHSRLVDIFSAIVERIPEARLLLVGRGSEESVRVIRRRVSERGLAESVLFAGGREDVPRLLKAVDLMVHPSVREGLPGVVLESCAAGTPVLASDLPGVLEIARRFPSVRTLPLGESDRVWAQTAAEILEDPDFRTRESRISAPGKFADSVFTIEECVRCLCSVWGNHVQEKEPAHTSV